MGDAAANVCMRQGNCRVDADCGADGFCSPSMGECGDYWGVVGWFCRTAEDECVNDSGCNDNDIWGPHYCAYNPAVGRWMCSDAACAG